MRRTTYTIALGLLFVTTIILFSLANKASKVLEVNNPVKTVKKLTDSTNAMATTYETSFKK